MMRSCMRALTLSAMFNVVVGNMFLLADINWGSKESGLSVGQDVQFNVGSGGMDVRGTLALADGLSSLTGSAVDFSAGLLDVNGLRALINATYSPDAAAYTLEQGYLHAQDGASFSTIAVKGTGNEITGVLHVSKGIVLQTVGNQHAALSLGIQNSLEADITLNSGTLALTNDLTLAKGVKIVGPGTVDKNNFRLIVNPADHTDWAHQITFVDGTGVDQLQTSVVNTINNITNNFNTINNYSTTLTNSLIQQQGGTSVVVQLPAGSSFVPEETPIVIAIDATIDGAGGDMTFANASADSPSLFQVADGKTVTLRNIRLCNITEKTFQLGTGSVVELGENVSLELGGSTFVTNGMFKIIPTQAGDANIVHLRGANGRKLFVLSPTDSNQTTLFDLNGNSLAVQEVEIVGSSFIAANGDAASVALAGNAVLDIENSSALNIDVEDTGNVLALTQDGLTLSGAISFDGLAAENTLAVRFVLNDPITDKTVTMIDDQGDLAYLPVKKGNPLVIFDGDSGLFLYNQSALAGLIFEDQSVTIANGLNSNTNAFVIDQNSYLMALDLEILGHPVKQNSARFVLEARSLTGAGIDQGFIRAQRAARDMRSRRPKTAFAQGCAKRRALRPIAKPRPVAPVQTSKEKVQAAIAKMKKNNARLSARTRSFAENEMLDMEEMDELLVRSLSIPVAYQRRVVDTVSSNAVPEIGTALYQGARIANFETVSTSAFTITLQDGAELTQKAGTTLLIDKTHFVNVIGVGNRVVVTGDATIDLGSLGFDHNAGLIIECEKLGVTAPTITLSGALDLAEGASLQLRGNGRVVLTDGTSLMLNGTADNQAAVSLGKGIDVAIAASGTAYVGGIGRFEVVDNAVLRVDQNAALHVADLPAALAAGKTHAVDVAIAQGGKLLVAMTTDNAKGAVRFIGNGEVSFAIDRAEAVVGKNGVIAFNVDGSNAPRRGWLKSFALKLASLRLYGSLILGPNKLDDKYADFMTTFEMLQATIDGGGSIIGRKQDPLRLTVTDETATVKDKQFVAKAQVAVPADFVGF